MIRRAKIIATGSYAPKKVLTNEYFDQLYGEDVDTFLRENRNIKQRHVCAEDECTSDLATQAAKRALQQAQLSPADLDLIIISTDTPDYISPATASVVQYKLGAKNAATFDINAACAGFVTALDVGSKFIFQDVHYRYVLVVGAYAMTKFLDWSDKKLATLFADGAGAVILADHEGEEGFLGAKLFADGSYYDYMGIYAGAACKPCSQQAIEKKEHLLQFVKKFPPDTNTRYWPMLVRELCDKIGCQVQDIDKIFFTQININSIHETMEKLGLPMERTHNVMDKYAYTGSACIPMALDDAVRQNNNNKMKRGDLVFFVGSGGGMAMASAAFRWAY